MTRVVRLVLLLVLTTSTSYGTTWFIRPDGGTRRSANVRHGQCDGQADAPYPGKGSNQHCAFNDYRYLYSDGTYNNKVWLISGGDTVIIRGGPWRVGQNGPNPAISLVTMPGTLTVRLTQPSPPARLLNTLEFWAKTTPNAPLRHSYSAAMRSRRC